MHLADPANGFVGQSDVRDLEPPDPHRSLGRFLLELPGASSGWQELLIEGTTANRPGAQYRIFELAVQRRQDRGAALHDLDAAPRHGERRADRVADDARGCDYDTAHPGWNCTCRGTR